MTAPTPRPALESTDSDLVIDLLDDCREVSGVLGVGWPDLPASSAPMATDLTLAAARLEGYEEYGS